MVHYISADLGTSGRGRKRSLDEGEGIHAISVTGHCNWKGTVAMKQLVEHLSNRDWSGKLKENLGLGQEMPKMAVQASKKMQMSLCQASAKMTHNQCLGATADQHRLDLILPYLYLATFYW